MNKKTLLTVLLMCTLLMSSCTMFSLTNTHPSVQALRVSYRPYRVIQLCLDTPPNYPAALFHQAANRIADWISADVTVNQDGFIVYTGEITSSSFQSNVLAPLQVPAIAADHQEPTRIPTYTPTPGQNPYAVANIQATRDALNRQTYTTWQRQLTSNHAPVAATRAKIAGALHKLRSLTPIYDDRGADAFGCLADAAQHFQSAPTAEHDLIVASPLINTTSVNQTPAIQLADAHVRVIYRTCLEAPQCAARDAWWKQTVSGRVCMVQGVVSGLVFRGVWRGRSYTTMSSFLCGSLPYLTAYMQPLYLLPILL